MQWLLVCSFRSILAVNGVSPVDILTLILASASNTSNKAISAFNVPTFFQTGDHFSIFLTLKLLCEKALLPFFKV